MLSRLLIALIHLYRRLIGPFIPPVCRFLPSCSHYAEEALREHGALKGSMLAGWRLLRCNPCGEYGHDPVPPQGWARLALRRRVIADRNCRQCESALTQGHQGGLTAEP